MKSAFITGANRGLGRGFIDYLLAQEYQVFAGTRQLPESTSPTEQLIWVEVDVASDLSIGQAFNLIQTHTSTLDLLINNAGVNKDTATNNQKHLVCNLESLDRQSLLKMFDINSISPLLVTKYFLPLLNAHDSFVINVSSCRASYHDEWGNQTANYGYRASKSALNMLTYCSLYDLPTHVKTFTVHHGSVHTDMNPDGSDTPLEQARQIVSIIDHWSDELNGRFLNYDGTVYPL